MNVFIHHFLFYSETPESTFDSLKIKYGLPEVFPITNFGFFKSGMLWLKNSYLEIVNYPKDIPAPNSNKLQTRFVGIAFKTDLPPEQTLEFLNKNNIKSSEILNEDVLDNEGNKVNIAKIILLNDYLHDFRIFFVFHTNDFFEEKEKIMPNEEGFTFNKCLLSAHNSLKVIELFKKFGFTFTDANVFKTFKHQTIQIIDSENLATDIIDFEIQKKDKNINILKKPIFDD
jgi:hypothetical protein